jgi:hypothetical protein
MYPLADARKEAIEQQLSKTTTIRRRIQNFFKRLQYVRQNFRRRASDRQVCNQRPCKRHFDLRKPAYMILHSCEGNPAFYNLMIDNFHGKRERRDGEVAAMPRYFIEADMPGDVEEGESYPRDHFISNPAQACHRKEYGQPGPKCGRLLRRHYRPINFGFRFSAKAVIPSFISSEKFRR